MPEISSDTTMAVSYPSEELYEQWVQQAEDLNLPVSRFIIRMVEAGRKELRMEDVATESLRDLREQEAELRSELEHQRERNKRLEQQLQHTAFTEIIEFIQSNPGVSTPEIIQHIADSVPGRVASHLDILQGDRIVLRDGVFYYEDPTETDETTESGEG